VLLVFVISAVLAGLARLMVALRFETVDAFMGDRFAFRALAVIIIGAIGDMLVSLALELRTCCSRPMRRRAGSIVLTATIALALSAWLFPAVRPASLALSGVLAGLVGGFFAHFCFFISPANFAASHVVDDLMFLVVGRLTLLGAAVGAIGLTLLPQVSGGLETWALAIYGLVVIVTIAIVPDGLFPKNRLACCAGKPGPGASWPRWSGVMLEADAIG